MSSFLAVRVSTERSQQHCGSPLQETIGGEIVDRDRDHEPVRRPLALRSLARIVHTSQDVVGQDRFLRHIRSR